jgi:hypothetical protein
MTAGASILWLLAGAATAGGLTWLLARTLWRDGWKAGRTDGMRAARDMMLAEVAVALSEAAERTGRTQRTEL